MITFILSWLLHHANRGSKNQHFYAIKNKILLKFGKVVGYDTQYIAGKKCHTCHGTGIYRSMYSDYQDHCYNCHNGWYKRPEWNYLQRIEFGKYIFHQPWKRSYTKPEVLPGLIDGYIEHNYSKHSNYARTIIFLVYDRNYLKRWWKDAGIGWRVYWWYPKAWPNNFAHLAKNGWSAIPITHLIERLWWLWDIQPLGMIQYQKKRSVERLRWYNHVDSDLPF